MDILKESIKKQTQDYFREFDGHKDSQSLMKTLESGEKLMKELKYVI